MSVRSSGKGQVVRNKVCGVVSQKLRAGVMGHTAAWNSSGGQREEIARINERRAHLSIL